ncbi:MAG TPA: ABC transporter permease [Solirubrobacteraceae bacterium]|nr:ABC transporter permease [Solirubrobacteraceae bacterium]
MLGYLLHRLALAVVVLFGLAVATFLIMHLVPGDPVQQTLGSRATPESIAFAREQLGLDDSLLAQFWAFVSNAVTGDLGYSLTLNAPVAEVVGQRVEPSALLIGYALLVSVVVGIPLAVIAAWRPNGVVDHAIRLLTTFAFAMPAFWVGLMLALVFGLGLKWFPVSGYETGIGGMLRTLTLPAITLGLTLSTIVARTLRSSLIEVLKSEYVEAATSRGLSPRRVMVKHAMRNAIMPTLTVLSVNLGLLIGYSIVVEAVFQIPGLGSLLLQSVQRRDYEIVQAIALIAGTAVVAISLATDLVQASIDPRVRLGR